MSAITIQSLEDLKRLEQEVFSLVPVEDKAVLVQKVGDKRIARALVNKNYKFLSHYVEQYGSDYFITGYYSPTRLYVLLNDKEDDTKTIVLAMSHNAMQAVYVLEGATIVGGANIRGNVNEAVEKAKSGQMITLRYADQLIRILKKVVEEEKSETNETNENTQASTQVQRRTKTSQSRVTEVIEKSDDKVIDTDQKAAQIKAQARQIQEMVENEIVEDTTEQIQEAVDEIIQEFEGEGQGDTDLKF